MERLIGGSRRRPYLVAGIFVAAVILLRMLWPLAGGRVAPSSPTEVAARGELALERRLAGDPRALTVGQWLRLAALKQRRRDVEGALQVLERAAAEHPADLRLLRALIRVNRRLGRHAEAARLRAMLSRLRRPGGATPAGPPGSGPGGPGR